MENLYEVIKDAQQKGYEKIFVIRDNCQIHCEINNEFASHIGQLSDDWQIIYGGGQITYTTQFNPEFYMNTYTDLAKAKIVTPTAAQKHWRTYGSREGRYGDRFIAHPEIIKEVCAIGIKSDVFKPLFECISPKKGVNISVNLTKFQKKQKNTSWIMDKYEQ